MLMILISKMQKKSLFCIFFTLFLLTDKFYQFGIEMFGGLLIRPIRTNKMSLNLTPGIHMSILSPKLTSDIASYISVGLGGDVSVDFALVFAQGYK